MKEVRESPFQSRAVKFLRIALAPYQGWAGAIPGGDRRATRAPGYVKGTPDVLCVVRGQAVLIELKSVKGVVSDEQKAVKADLERAGAVHFIARSMPELESIVETLKMGRAA